MTYQVTVGDRAAVRRAASLLATLSDQLTITGQLIERGAQSEYPLEGAPTEYLPPGAGENRCPWLPFVCKQLQAIGALSKGWDSHGSPSPDPRLVRAARGLIHCLAQGADVAQPHVNPTPNGGVQFEWEDGDRYFELEVVAERAATYLYCDDAARVEETGNVFEQESLEPVLALVRRVGPLR